nr:hypothetical protein [Tanacetum cinerariifolium]
MSPKRTTTATTPMTDAAIKALIAQGIADDLAEYEANRSSGNGDDSHDSGSDRRSEIKKLEIKIWNLMVKGIDVVSYTQRFQELALMCSRMFPEESDKIRSFADRQAKNKRKLDDNSRNNQNQQYPFKRQNMARAYTAGPMEKKVYGESKPISPTANANANNQRNFRAIQMVVTCFKAIAKAFAVGNAGKNLDFNVVT